MDYKKKYKEEKNIKEVNEIFKGLKSYSIYFGVYKSRIIKSVCQNILNNGQNLEELEITEIKKSESFYFITVLDYTLPIQNIEKNNFFKSVAMSNYAKTFEICFEKINNGI